MNLNIKTTSTSLTPAIREYFEKKIQALNKLIDLEQDNVLIQAELGKTSKHHRSGEFFKAEVNVNVAGTTYRAESEKEDLYEAIDEVKDRLMHEIKTSKDKHTSSVRKGSQKIKNILKSGDNEDVSN
jgi:putative sigma-54 modulation protein